jgi:hypothetical protein
MPSNMEVMFTHVSSQGERIRQNQIGISNLYWLLTWGWIVMEITDFALFTVIMAKYVKLADFCLTLE